MFEGEMKIIVENVNALTKSAGGQMDKLLDEAIDFKFRMRMVEDKIKRMQDELHEMGMKVSAYGTAVALLTKMHDERKLKDKLANAKMDLVTASLKELDTKVTFIFNKVK